MLIYVVIIIILVLIISVLVYVIIVKQPKTKLLEYEKELIMFTIKMYLDYGGQLDILPDEKSKNKLIIALNKLNEKIKELK